MMAIGETPLFVDGEIAAVAHVNELTLVRRAGGDPRNWIIAASLLVIALVWLLRPSPYAKVRNLGSRGTAIIAFGDSLTAGYGAAAGEDYPSRLSFLLGAPVLNRGVSGDTTDAALARLDAD